jgi:thiol-disulfide isomerase/thioredoxin
MAVEMRTSHRPILALTLIVLVGGCTGTGEAPSGSGIGASRGTPAAVSAPGSSEPAATSSPAKSPTAAKPLYDPTADARAEILAAVAAAKADGKLVLVDFGADWCPDCHVLSAYLHGPAGQTLVDASFHVVAVDVGYWNHNLDVAKSYGDAIWKGIPAVVVVDGDGRVLRSTADGSLASAASMSESDVLAILAHLAE